MKVLYLGESRRSTGMGGHLRLAEITTQALREHGGHAIDYVPPKEALSMSWEGYDVVHGGIDHVGARKAHKAGIPYIGFAPVSWWEECRFMYRTGRGGLYRIPQTAIYARAMIDVRRGVRAADVITVQRTTADSMLRHIPSMRSKLFIWEHGTDSRFFTPEGARDDGFVLYVGRLEFSKGVDTLLEAVRGLDMPVLVAGTGSKRAQLEAMAPPNVKFLGEVDDAQLLDLYRGASMAVFPSRFEGFGLVALEALSCGTPTAVTSGYGFRLIPPASEWVEWFAPDDARGCRAAIERLRGRKTPAWSRDAHEMVAKHHDQRDRAREIVGLYERLVGTRR